jgi:hypothetical protein
MAAEKLTKGRLIQLLVTFAVLIAAFVWRTLDHPNLESKAVVTCKASSACLINFEGDKYRLNIKDSSLRFELISDSTSNKETLVIYKQKNYSISEEIALDKVKKHHLVITNKKARINVNVISL